MEVNELIEMTYLANLSSWTNLSFDCIFVYLFLSLGFPFARRSCLCSTVYSALVYLPLPMLSKRQRLNAAYLLSSFSSNHIHFISFIWSSIPFITANSSNSSGWLEKKKNINTFMICRWCTYTGSRALYRRRGRRSRE